MVVEDVGVVAVEVVVCDETVVEGKVEVVCVVVVEDIVVVVVDVIVVVVGAIVVVVVDSTDEDASAEGKVVFCDDVVSA